MASGDFIKQDRLTCPYCGKPIIIINKTTYLRPESYNLEVRVERVNVKPKKE